jgi:RNA polymerase sigma factor (sigma-70 family)
VFQGVCVKLIEHLNDLKDESKVSSWLITITTRQCIALRSSHSRESSTDDLSVEPPSPGQSLEEIQIQTQKSQMVRDAVEELPDRCRRLLQMLYLDQSTKTYEDIAKTLDIPVPSIGPTRARCLDRLRTLLRRKRLYED